MAMAGEETLKLWLGRELLVEVDRFDLRVYIIQPPRCLETMVMGEVFLKKLPFILKALKNHFENKIEYLKGKESLSYGEEEKLKLLEEVSERLGDVFLTLLNMIKLVDKLAELDRVW